MIDIQHIRDNPERFKQAASDKYIAADIDRLLDIDKQLGDLKKQLQDIATYKNKLGKSIPKLAPEEKKTAGRGRVEIDDSKRIVGSLHRIAEPFRQPTQQVNRQILFDPIDQNTIVGNGRHRPPRGQLSGDAIDRELMTVFSPGVRFRVQKACPQAVIVVEESQRVAEHAAPSVDPRGILQLRRPAVEPGGEKRGRRDRGGLLDDGSEDRILRR